MSSIWLLQVGRRAGRWSFPFVKMRLSNVAALLLHLTIVQVESLECFHCHQTTAACNDGTAAKLRTRQCSGACYAIKYETNMSGRMVAATVRGCAEEQLAFQPENPQVVTTAAYNCSQPLCNHATSHLLPFRQPHHYFLTLFWALIAFGHLLR